jgi:predicted outer membrane repeat protein
LLGGAVRNNGNLIITSSQFNGNAAIKGNGGAICNIGQLTLNSNNIFNKNLAINGGAIFNANNLKINKNNTFTNNSATSNGGAIYNSLIQMNGQNYVGNATIESNIFKDNTASYGGAIENDGTLTVKTSTFTDNIASNGDGGAIYSVGI